jgi:hypothetical protein
MPEPWQFGPGVPTGEVELEPKYIGEGKGPLRDIPPERSQDPMSMYTDAYDQRTEEVVSRLQDADRRDRFLEMGAGVFDAGIGNYTGAMGNVFKTQADYNRRPAAYEEYRSQRDTGKVDELYKLMQARKAAMGEPPTKFEAAMAMAETPEKRAQVLGLGPNWKYVPFGDGIGGFWQDSGTTMVKDWEGRDYDISTPGGMAAFKEQEAIAQARSPQAQKAAGEYLSQQQKYEAFTKLFGDNQQIAALLGESPPVDQERIMRKALETVYMQMEGIDQNSLRQIPTDRLISTLHQWAGDDPQKQALIAEILNSSLAGGMSER